MSAQLKSFQKIDSCLEEYYNQQGHSGYRDANGRGKFMQYIIDEELNDEELPIESELGDACDPTDCTYTSMYENTEFPTPSYIRMADQRQKEAYIFYVMQYCHKYNKAPSEKYIRSIVATKIGATIVDIMSPLQITRAGLNVSETMKAYKYLRHIVQEKFPNDFVLHYYMNVSVSMQINDKQMRKFKILENGSSQLLSIINYDLHLKYNGQSIYGIITPDADHKWKLQDFLTERDIERDYKIEPNELPTSSRKMLLIAEQLKTPPTIEEALFTNTNWRSVPRNKGILKNFKIPEITTRMSKISWIEECMKSFKNDKLPFIPIIVTDDNNHWIEWIKIIEIDVETQKFYVGVGIKHIVNKKLISAFCARNCKKNLMPQDILTLIMNYGEAERVSSIHLDIDYIYCGHQLLGLYGDKVIDFVSIGSFRPFITHLIIQDVYIYPNC